MQFDRAKFFEEYKKQFGSLKQSQVDALDDLLDCVEVDAEITDARYFAYMLATIKHETAHTYRPIAEYGKGRGRKYGIVDKITGQVYYGRGFVQLTWKFNYEYFTDRLGEDLINNPDLAMDPDIAYDIMVIGMLEGRFTGKKLSDYINATKTDYRTARKIINGMDKCDLIAGYAVKFESIIKNSING